MRIKFHTAQQNCIHDCIKTNIREARKSFHIFLFATPIDRKKCKVERFCQCFDPCYFYQNPRTLSVICSFSELQICIKSYITPLLPF